MTSLDPAGSRSDVTWEYLAPEGPQRVRRWPLWLALAVLGALTAAGLGLRWSDSVAGSARAELAQLLARSEEVASAGERSVQGTLAYASPMIWSSSVPEDVRAELRALVQASAEDTVTELEALRARAAGVLVLPWQESIEQARHEVDVLLQAQTERFAGISADARDIDRVLADGPIPTGAAEAALARASAS